MKAWRLTRNGISKFASKASPPRPKNSVFNYYPYTPDLSSWQEVTGQEVYDTTLSVTRPSLAAPGRHRDASKKARLTDPGRASALPALPTEFVAGDRRPRSF